jgi:hypothetical protein
MERYNNENIIEKFKNIHSDKYNYSLVDYKNSYTKVKIICPVHGEFEQNPKHHYNGVGCSSCSNYKKLTTDKFIQKSKLVHSDKYDYSLVDYVNRKTKVKIICQEHGIFEQIAADHINGHGCRKCLSYSKQEFILLGNNIHNNKYDYSLIEIINNQTKIEIVCLKHGIFKQTPYNHLGGRGCPKCVGRNKTTIDLINELIEIHGDKYDYSLVDYVDSYSKIKIICQEHGQFEQTSRNHLTGSGCPKCIGRNKTSDEFVLEAKSIHGDKYDYSNCEYIDTKNKIKIICTKHGVFEQKPTYHLDGTGCPICKESKGEREIRNFLTENNIEFIPQYKFGDCKNIKLLPFDFYLPDYNTCIEFNGRQHYEPLEHFGGIINFKKQQINDKIKNDYCKSNNISLITIRYDEKVKDKLIGLI